MRRLTSLWPVLAGAGLIAGAFLAGDRLRAWMTHLTGEHDLWPQLYGSVQTLGGLLRPPLDLAPEVPVMGNGVNPFGVNTFLHQEVEPAKRERQVRLIAEAGFHWLRQEFPWYDIEIDGSGNFQDCRHGACVSAWAKYDQIVDLAEQHGLQFIARISAPPEWSQTERASRGDFVPPDDFDALANFAAAAAVRYRGRVTHFQIWNEPNAYPEWGNQPVDPEAYTDLLCRAYRRLKAIDPAIVVLSGALAPTNELGGLNEFGGNNLNDLIFLQRMLDAGAGECFDILSMQGYGLFSGPSDRRRSPILVNYNRPALVRDLMVRNGLSGKAIWISEMNWNAVPEGLPADYGRVTEALQAEYAPVAYERAQAEWPWVGVNNFWFFKRADDSERNQAWYYFRMLEPDFTPLPVYASLKAYTATAGSMYPGYFQEDHWAVEWTGDWTTVQDERAVLGAYRQAVGAAGLEFQFVGGSVLVVPGLGSDAGRMRVIIDDQQVHDFDLSQADAQSGVPVTVVAGLSDGPHRVRIENLARSDGSFGRLAIDGFIVRRARPSVTLVVTAVAWLVGMALAIFGRRAMRASGRGS